VLGNRAVAFVDDHNSQSNQKLRALQDENMNLKSEVASLKVLLDRSTNENQTLRKFMDKMGTPL